MTGWDRDICWLISKGVNRWIKRNGFEISASLETFNISFYGLRLAGQLSYTCHVCRLHRRSLCVCLNTTVLYTVSQKTVPLYMCSYLWQMLTDSRNSFTVAFSEKFATKPASYFPAYDLTDFHASDSMSSCCTTVALWCVKILDSLLTGQSGSGWGQVSLRQKS